MLVYDPDKAGVDAGLLCGEKPVGVAATLDPAEVIALRADCVLYMPRVFAVDDVVALLESGTNVVTTRGEVFGGGRKLAADDRSADRGRLPPRCVVDLCDGKQPRVHQRRVAVRAAVTAAPRRWPDHRRVRQPFAA